jgi:hypothetical protein
MDQIALNFDEHVLVRSRDPLTSVVAAMRTKEFRARHVAKIWAALKDAGPNGLTKDELAAWTGLDHIAVARRMREGIGRLWLVSDMTRPSKTGRAETVWCVL